MSEQQESASIALTGFVVVSALLKSLQNSNILSATQIRDLLDEALTHLEAHAGQSTAVDMARQLIEKTMLDLA